MKKVKRQCWEMYLIPVVILVAACVDTESFEEKKVGNEVPVVAKSEKKCVLKGIAVERMPDKTVYGVGESLDLTGLMIYGNYSDGNRRKENKYSCNPAEGTKLRRTGEEKVKITVGRKSVGFSVTVKEFSREPEILVQVSRTLRLKDETEGTVSLSVEVKEAFEMEKTLSYQWYCSEDGKTWKGVEEKTRKSMNMSPKKGITYYYCAITNSEEGKLPVTVKSGVCEVSCGVGSCERIGTLHVENGRPIGVVFDVYEDGHVKKIVSLERHVTSSGRNVCWFVSGKEPAQLGESSLNDGRKNMDAVRAIDPEFEDFPIFRWCAERGEGWYLPAVEELNQLWGNCKAVKKILEENGYNWDFNRFCSVSSTNYGIKRREDGTGYFRIGILSFMDEGGFFGGCGGTDWGALAVRAF